MRSLVEIVASACLALHGCSSTPSSIATAEPKPAALLDAMAEDSPVRVIAERQLAALSANDNAALAATFAPDAMFMVPSPTDRDSALVGLRDSALALDPTEEFRSAALGEIRVRGNERAAWIDFDIQVIKRLKQQGPTGNPELDEGFVESEDIYVTVRVSELVTASAEWKVVAASFTRMPEPKPRAGTPYSLGDATPAGPLAGLLATTLPRGLAIHASREVTHAEWGFVQALVDGGHENGIARYAAMLVALPDGTKWRSLGVEIHPL